MNEIKGKRVLILGYGREGQSTERFLHAHYPGLTIDHADQNDGMDYLNNLSQYDTVIRSPGISVRVKELADYKKSGGWVTSATNIFFDLCPGMTIGVTGTKGKSTTASLIAHILTTAGAYRGSPSDVRLVGNIGKPMLDHLEGAKKETIFVIELSSHQLEDIRYSPHIAVMLAIVPEHLDYYPRFDTYVAAKGNIVRFQKTEDAVLFNPANKLVARLVQKSKAKKIPFTTFSSLGVQLRGNKENISGAVSVAKFLGVSEEHIHMALKTFAPLPHRLEFVGTFGGITFYNDSLATIPEATIHALDALGADVATLIAGGFDRGLDFTKLGDYLNAHPVKTLILFPDTGKKIWEAIQGAQAGPAVQKFDVTTMEEAVKLAYTCTPRGKICLLSPASASFNLFKNYEDRGNQFKEWVKKLAK